MLAHTFHNEVKPHHRSKARGQLTMEFHSEGKRKIHKTQEDHSTYKSQEVQKVTRFKRPLLKVYEQQAITRER